jgi:hypothetical protein
MRRTSLTLAALAVVLAGSLTSIARAEDMGRDQSGQPADLTVAQTTHIEQEAKSVAIAPKGSTGIYDNFDQFRDATGRPLPGWQQLFYGNN